MMKWTNLLFALTLSFCTLHLTAQNPAPIIFIVDASGSMWGQIDGEAKMQIAKTVLNDLVGKMPAEQALGLVAYGHRQKGDCRDVEYLVGTDSADKNAFQHQLMNLKPLGKTPLAYSAKLVIDDLRTSGKKATVILVTDGVETCDGDLCQLVKDAKAEGIEFKMHIVGFDLKPEEKAALQCAAEAGEGDYFDAKSAEELTEVLDETTHETVDSPPANCLLTATKNGELIDAFVKIIDQKTKQEMRPQRTYSDTVDFFLPLGSYVFQANVIGADSRGMASVSQQVDITENGEAPTHITFSFDAGQVYVSVKNNGAQWDATVRVYATGESKELDACRTYSKGCSFELNAGTYDVKILPLNIKGEETRQFKTITVQANQLDTLDFGVASGEAYIGAEYQGALVDASVNIVPVGTQNSVASGRTYVAETSNPKKFILLPGEYKVTIKALKGPAKGTEKEIPIVVKAGAEVREMVEF